MAGSDHFAGIKAFSNLVSEELATIGWRTSFSVMVVAADSEISHSSKVLPLTICGHLFAVFREVSQPEDSYVVFVL